MIEGNHNQNAPFLKQGKMQHQKKTLTSTRVLIRRRFEVVSKLTVDGYFRHAPATIESAVQKTFSVFEMTV